MKTTEFLSELRSLDIKVYLEGDRLRVNGPKGAITPDIKAELADRKAEIIEFIKSSNNLVTDGNKQAIKKISREKEIPLSSAQLGLWFVEQLEPGSSSAYNISRTLSISGKLNYRALEESLGEIVRRHESLRTNFAIGNGQPHQVIKAHENFSLAIEELEEVPISERRGKALEYATAMAQQRFDLAKGPLYQFKLLCIEPSEHLLQVVMHHMVSDGWSIRLFQRELTASYSACCQGVKEKSPLAPLPIQYADYAYWQQEWLKGEQYQEQLAYWKQRLGGSLPVLELPTDYPRPRVQTYRGEREELQLSWELSDKLKQLSQRAGVTLAMTMLAGFKTLLYRHSGQEDLIVGTPLAGRNQVEVEGLIGFFISTLVLRTDLSGNPSFSSLLSRIRSCTLGAYAHQEMPFEKLVEELQPDRDMSRTPIFQVWFNMQNLGEDKLELSGLTVESLSPEEVQSKFDLTLYVRELKEGIKCEFVYNADLFAPERIAQMAEQLQYLLMQVADNPEAKIAHLSLVTPAAQSLLPDPRVALAEPYYEPITVTFADWVRRTPEQQAIRQGSRSWTYKQLAERAQAIAARLAGEGVKVGEVVAVSGDRSFGLIASMMGVLSSGAVMLVIDPLLPSSRQQLMLSQSGAKHLLYVSDSPPETSQMWEEISPIDVDPDTGDLKTPLSARVETPMEREITPEDGAYIFFTSGTTGVPKGVLGVHKGLAHFLQWQRETFSIGPGDRVSQLIGLSFDAVLRDIFLPLTSGATLCLPARTEELLSHRIFPWLEKEGISVVHTVPALAQAWVPNVPAGIELKALRWIFFAGEPLTSQLVNQWRSAFPDSGEIVNLYGATETTMVKCYYQLPSEPIPGVQPVGIAQPQTQVLILSDNQQLCGLGETGEIVLRTPFRTKGYINASTENQRLFVQNPYRQEDPRDLLYLTGDLGRYRADGTVEIMGRKDEQVKIRGIRIELGEIQSILGQHPGVASAVVIARSEETGEKRLVAYVVPKEPQTVGIEELRSFLKQKLPSYMVPSAFVLLEAIPLTANGKVDRRALPAPSDFSEELAEDLVAPQTMVEKKLASLWSEVLGVEQLGIYNNFFALGGHSLLAIKVMSRISEAFGVQLTLATLFENPTIAELAKCIETASLTSSEIMQVKLVPIDRDQDLPLSSAQLRLWFLEQFSAGSYSAYNISSTLSISGKLNYRALEQSLGEIVRRHESLRTNFATSSNGQPHQVIAAPENFSLAIEELEEVPISERRGKALEYATAMARRKFDLTGEPLYQFKLLCIEPSEHLLQIVMHHIVSDGWSSRLFKRELTALYSAFSQGLPSPLPPLPIQYADYAYWQQEWLKGEQYQEQLAYWKQVLGGSLPVLELPTDYPRPPVQSYRGSRERLQLSPELSDKIKQLSQREGVTLYMTMLAAFNVLLSRYSGQSDIIVGSPIANRNRSEIESQIGFFANTLVLRTDLGGNPSFQELVGRVRSVALDAYARQDLPFEKLVEELQPSRDLSRNPLFQVMFALQNIPSNRWELPEIAVRKLEVENKTAKFDMSLALWETETGIKGRWEYNTDLFEGATISRMIGNFYTLLEAIVAYPERPVGSLPLLTRTEGHQLLVEWNDTKVEYQQSKCIHQLFEEQVERSPDAVAVRFENEELTYRELNARANQLASYLQNLGVSPERLVGLYVERSLEMVVGLLGILKAGGAYVPLDPMYPPDRIAHILSSSEMKLLVSQEKLLASLPKHSARTVCLDTESQIIARRGLPNPVRTAQPDNLAYVIYTSGSTGQPKGVAICHKSLVNFLSSMQVAPGLSNVDAILAVTTICFDIAALEIYLPLTVGAKILMVSREVAADGERLRSRLENSGATVMQATPATWRMLLAAGWQGSPQLKIICGGEALPRELADDLLPKGASVWNLYGPTETTVWSTLSHVNRSDVSGKGRDVSELIGTPIANTKIYILDGNLQPVPIGVPGELHIGGVGLARGYLNRPELTLEKFIPNPFSDEPEERLYKTGDLARYRPDGNIEYISRIDNQVKIRGFRIELGEIEAVLQSHPSLRSAVAIAREDSPGDKRLVAYVVLHQEQKEAVSVDELRQLVKQKLPSYMVPSAFVLLETLPLTPNGKVDRRALPAPELDPRDEASFVPPQTPCEELLANIYAEVLGIKVLGIDDNFFDLGGHSLLAIKVVSRVLDAFGVQLTLATLFENPTIAELAKCIITTPLTTSVKLVPIDRDQDLPLSSAQLRLWFLEQLEPGSSSAYNTSRTFKITGKLNIEALELCLGEIVRRHEGLRTKFVTQEGQPHQVIAAYEKFSLPYEKLEDVPRSERRGKALEYATAMKQQRFDLAKGPLYQFKLLCIEPEEHLLQIVIHHIVSDGWSSRLFGRELTALYEAYTQGLPSPLAPLPIQYADYAHCQQEWLKGSQYQEQLAYWKQVLGGSLPVLDLPTDYPRPPVQTYRGDRLRLQLSPELSDKLKQLNHKVGVTLAMTMLAAFKALLYRHSGQEDLIVGTPVAGRNQVEVEGLIGFFISTLVLRTDLSGNPSFSQLLSRIRSCTLSAYAHQEMPFEKLVEELQPSRDMSRTPIFQVWFNMINLEESKLELSGLTVESLAREEVQSKFDLTLYVKELQVGIKCEFVYNADLFAPERIAQMAEQLQYLLMQVADNPEAYIAHLSLVTPAAQSLLPDPTSALNSVWEGAVHTHFSQQARRVPERLAVIDAQMAHDYGSLNARSNQLAHYLLANGIGSQDIVAIYAHRSAALVWALLGVLKAGAAFVILDPAYPSSRLIDCLGIAAPRGWLQLAAAPQPGPELLEVINELPLRLELPADIMATVPELGDYETSDPAVTVGPEDLAYLAFTSGSTGLPKGIAGSHKPLSHFMGWHAQTFGLTEGDRFSMLSGLSHDPLLRDIFTPLCIGATLYIPSQQDLETKGQLAHWMERQQISITHLTPAMGQLLSETTIALPQLRYGFFGGDRLTPQDLARMEKLAPEVTCVNFYGATETPQAMGYFICPKSSDQSLEWVGGPSIPIGRGIADVQLLVLNSQQQLAGIGEVGEVYVRTPYLAKGYIGSMEMTTERFIVNPLTKIAGDMLYRTGDLARYLPDGNIVFQGRADNQVKIRGFRIETGEIEAILAQHPAVAEAVAIAREDRPGDKRLVAYVVLHQEQQEAVTVDELRQLVKQKLPSYMVPSAFVLLEAIPLTPNGKVDKRALPAPERNLASSVETFVAPEDELERQLVEIWQSVLGVDPIGVKDDFFELGGHSLLAVTLFSEIEKVTKQKLPLATLFQAPTIAELGKIIRTDGWSAPWSPLVAMQPNGSKPPFFCVHAVGGNVLSYRELAMNLGQDQPVYGLQAEGLDGQKQNLDRIQDIAANYTQAMRHLQPEGPYYLGGYSFGGMVAFEIAQQLYAQGQEVALLVLFDTREPSLRPTFQSWLSFHVKNLIQLEPQEKLNYIKVKTGLGIEGNWDLIEALRQMYRRNTTRKGRRLYNPPEAQIRPYEKILESNRKAYSRYVPQALPGRVTLLRAKMGSASVHADPEGGWGKVALKGVEVHEVPGDHISIFQQPKVQVLASTLNACIEKAARGASQ